MHKATFTGNILVDGASIEPVLVKLDDLGASGETARILGQSLGCFVLGLSDLARGDTAAAVARLHEGAAVYGFKVDFKDAK